MALSFTTHLTMEKFSKRMHRLWNSFCDSFSAVSHYIAKQEDFPKIVQVNRKCVNSFDVDCTYVTYVLHTYIHTCKQTDKKQAERQMDRQMDIHAYIHTYIHTYVLHTYIQIDRPTDGQTFRHSHRHTDRWTQWHTYKQTAKQTNRQTHLCFLTTVFTNGTICFFQNNKTAPNQREQSHPVCLLSLLLPRNNFCTKLWINRHTHKKLYAQVHTPRLHIQ